MAPPIIEYRRVHDFATSPSELWTAIGRVDEFERWWPWLDQFRLEGDGLVAGSVLHGVVSPPVPYRMRIEVELVRCVPARAIDAVVHGDLRGDARLRLRPGGGGTQAEVAWSVEMMQRPMRLASVFTRPILQWGHDRVVDMTVAGFKRQLADVTGTGPLSGEPGHGQGGGQEHDGP
ncbi:MAG: SRPBCC family protein [Acidimicrobiales bacterium]